LCALNSFWRPAIISIWSINHEIYSFLGDKLLSPNKKHQSGFIMVTRYAVLEVVEWKLVCSKFILETGSHFYMEYAPQKIFLSRE
jgi:sorbitol-specific phosphotransferase system component IIC